jgi:hypothetical protein
VLPTNVQSAICIDGIRLSAKPPPVPVEPTTCGSTGTALQECHHEQVTVQVCQSDAKSCGTLTPYRVVRKCVPLKDERVLGETALPSSIDAHSPASVACWQLQLQVELTPVDADQTVTALASQQASHPQSCQ